MRLSPYACLLVLASIPARAEAQSTILTFDGDVPDDSATHFFLPFEVPAGTVEIEVRHDDQSSENILDWGLEDASGFRGWGGGNTEPAVVGLDRASRSYVPGPITPGTWRVVVGKAKVTSLPGTYHVEVELRTTGTLLAQPERGPYVPVAALRTGAEWLAGDFHVHSIESGDAHGTLDEIAALAESRGLDFVAISDHNTHTALDFFADAQPRHPDLLFVPSVEYTTYAGHANGIGATTWVNHRTGVEGVTIDAAVAAYHAQGAFFSINHPAFELGDACIGCAWKQPLAASEIDGLEIMTSGQAVVRVVIMDQSMALWDQLCDTGRHVVALGGSDDHRAGLSHGSGDSPVGDPTTMVRASELSVAGILAGLRAGRTVVRIPGPSAPMVVLDSRDLREGTDTIHRRRTTLTIDVEDGTNLSYVVMKNGVEVGPGVTIPGSPYHAELEVEAPETGEDRYRVEIVDMIGRAAVTSHVYLTRLDAPTDGGCGCSTGTSATGHAPSLIAPLALAMLGLAVRRRTRGA